MPNEKSTVLMQANASMTDEVDMRGHGSQRVSEKYKAFNYSISKFVSPFDEVKS